jgi:hypothetical protein
VVVGAGREVVGEHDDAVGALLLVRDPAAAVAREHGGAAALAERARDALEAGGERDVDDDVADAPSRAELMSMAIGSPAGTSPRQRAAAVSQVRVSVKPWLARGQVGLGGRPLGAEAVVEAALALRWSTTGSRPPWLFGTGKRSSVHRRYAAAGASSRPELDVEDVGAADPGAGLQVGRSASWMRA